MLDTKDLPPPRQPSRLLSLLLAWAVLGWVGFVLLLLYLLGVAHGSRRDVIVASRIEIRDPNDRLHASLGFNGLGGVDLDIRDITNNSSLRGGVVGDGSGAFVSITGVHGEGELRFDSNNNGVPRVTVRGPGGSGLLVITLNDFSKPSIEILDEAGRPVSRVSTGSDAEWRVLPYGMDGSGEAIQGKTSDDPSKP